MSAISVTASCYPDGFPPSPFLFIGTSLSPGALPHAPRTHKVTGVRPFHLIYSWQGRVPLALQLSMH